MSSKKGYLKLTKAFFTREYTFKIFFKLISLWLSICTLSPVNATPASHAKVPIFLLVLK